MIGHTVKELCALLGRERHAVCRLIQSGRLRAIPGVKPYIVPKAEFEDFLKTGGLKRRVNWY